MSKLDEVKTKAGKFFELEEKKLGQENLFNVQFLEENHGITKEDTEALYTYAKFQYECGEYEVSIYYLSWFRSLNSDPQKDSMATWGILASVILMSRWKEAEHEIGKIREAIEDPKVTLSPLKQLQLRLWLIHWSLFVYFHLPNGAALIIDFFLGNERYLRAI